MGRFRSFVRRWIKPAAMVGTVGVLSSMLIITTPSNAQAFKARDLKAAETFVMGAAKTIAPVAVPAIAVASAVTPVGWVLRAAQLGLLAYETQDVWMPFVAGAFGAASGSDANTNVPAGGGSAPIIAGTTMNVLQKSADGKSYTAMYNNSTGNLITIGLSLRVQCKNESTGALFTGSSDVNVATNNTTKDGGTSYTCPASWPVAMGAVAGRFGADPRLGAVCTTSGAPCSKGGPGNVLRDGTLMSQANPGFDPYGADVKYKVTNQCIAPDGTISSVSAESSGDYMKFPSCSAAGKGHGTGKTTITGLAPGSTQEKTLWDSPVAPSDPATPLCDATRPTDGCTISVELDGKPCTTDNVECQNWAEIQKNDPNNTRLKCKFGPYYVPMAQCAVLEGAYLVGGSPATKENTDGDPATKNWLDPSGGQLAPKTPAQTGVGTSTVPGGSGSPAPSSAPADQKMAQCFPTGWAMLNPVEWVLKPVRCAFEPSQTPTQIQARANGVMTLAQGKAPISFLSLEMTGPSGGGCPNWNVAIPGTSVNQNIVCGSSFTDAILSVRAPLFGLLATVMVWPLIRSLWYAAIPVLRVTPSDGGK